MFIIEILNQYVKTMTHSCILKFFILPSNVSHNFTNQKTDVVLEALRLHSISFKLVMLDFLKNP